jgi:hypothetical protein
VGMWNKMKDSVYAAAREAGNSVASKSKDLYALGSQKAKEAADSALEASKAAANRVRHHSLTVFWKTYDVLSRRAHRLQKSM